MIYQCCNQNRKSLVLEKSTLNGIDFLEVLDHDAIALDSPRQQTLLVYCLRTVPAVAAENVLIEGGESITDIGVEWVGPASGPLPQANSLELPYFAGLPNAANVLVVRTNKAGDFSPYTLRLVNNAPAAAQDVFEITGVLDGFDSQLACVEFSFKVECGPDFDCEPAAPDCQPSAPAPPPINYLAKDYGSFRTIMLDRLNLLLPTWGGTSEADLGVALAELVAYAGDLLSYQQDAIATEAYIETARSRISLRRHALLVDYHVHDGCNARAWVAVQTAGNPTDQVFMDRTLTRFYTFAPGMPSSLAVGAGNEQAALTAGVQVFEPVCDAVLYPALNQISFHTWGDTDCCLPQGATEATLKGSYSQLVAGDVLIFQEMIGPQTGDPADADIRHRCAVRLTQVVTQDDEQNWLVDPLCLDSAGNPIKVTEIQWFAADALPFPVCISSSYLDDNNDTQFLTDVSVAFGNVVLADHGLTLSDVPIGTVPQPSIRLPVNPAASRCNLTPPAYLPVRFRPQVPNSPLTQAVPLDAVSLASLGNPVTTAPVPLDATGSVTLPNTSGFACLTLAATNPAGWPSSLGIVVSKGASTGSFNLSVVYNPPGGAAGLLQQIVLEHFTDLTLAQSDPSYAPKAIKAQSVLIQVPATYSPPATLPGSFPATPTMLQNVAPVNLQDLSSPPVAYLTLQANNPAGWPACFGVSAGASAANPADFDLQVQYAPQSGGVGVTLPVTVEEFASLTLATAATVINSASDLIQVEGFAQTSDSSLSASELVNVDATQAVPVITLTGTLNQETQTWQPVQDLLESGESDTVFVVEIDTDGTALLRFGDDTNGAAADSGTVFTGTVRIGNGTAGNVGADSLVYLAAADARFQSCRNPLPASGGTDPETNAEIRRRAPQAFMTQERAVTMADYETVAESNAQVDQAVASLCWTGSWYTVFIAVEPQGGGNLTPALARTLKRTIEGYRLAGQDLQLDSPQYVSLEIELVVCVDPSYFQSDVEQSLLQVLSDQILPNGQKGLFYPDSFTFGQTVYLSPVYAAARSVPGVVTVTATKFQPQGVNTSQYLAAGEIPLGSLQIARLENDPSYPDHGQLTLVMEGGK
jgi:hypothetical protein